MSCGMGSLGNGHFYGPFKVNPSKWMSFFLLRTSKKQRGNGSVEVAEMTLQWQKKWLTAPIKVTDAKCCFLRSPLIVLPLPLPDDTRMLSTRYNHRLHFLSDNGKRRDSHFPFPALKKPLTSARIEPVFTDLGPGTPPFEPRRLWLRSCIVRMCDGWG